MLPAQKKKLQYILQYITLVFICSYCMQNFALMCLVKFTIFTTLRICLDFTKKKCKKNANAKKICNSRVMICMQNYVHVLIFQNSVWHFWYIADPYVKVSLMCDGRRLKKRKTSTKRNTLNPIYNEAIVFDVPPENIDQISLLIAVMDYDR